MPSHGTFCIPAICFASVFCWLCINAALVIKEVNAALQLNWTECFELPHFSTVSPFITGAF